MKFVREFVTSTVVGGLFVVVPVYLAVLLLLKGMKSVAGLVRPFAKLLPDSLPAEDFFALLAVLVVCFIVGMLVRTRAGRVARESLEKMFFERLPGYALLRGLTQRLAGEDENTAWAPALVRSRPASAASRAAASGTASAIAATRAPATAVASARTCVVPISPAPMTPILMRRSGSAGGSGPGAGRASAS